MVCHLGVRDIMRLARTGRLGKDVLVNTSPEDVLSFSCESCVKGKTGRLPSSPAPENTCATAPLGLLHVGLWSLLLLLQEVVIGTS
uniref:GAG-pre-integrase domain-containing protein n=1 Tax=Kwoniella bestiolae CBS 10118 TaxID=1296100 RepID=A0A1B9FZW7_9TREE|nr:hypothetical protein I302_05771 [Kwoniella bestiolae CBS 10118]OCF24312.1 hypothetical protein I302_05771 [Kwoniella bestiolae CBS 10118]